MAFVNLSASFQTELAINTNMMVAHMHRNSLIGQEGVFGQHHSVSVVSYHQQNNADCPIGSSQVSDNEYDGTHSLMFS
jgi:hypothetical protein